MRGCDGFKTVSNQTWVCAPSSLLSPGLASQQYSHEVTAWPVPKHRVPKWRCGSCMRASPESHPSTSHRQGIGALAWADALLQAFLMLQNPPMCPEVPWGSVARETRE